MPFNGNVQREAGFGRASRGRTVALLGNRAFWSLIFGKDTWAHAGFRHVCV